MVVPERTGDGMLTWLKQWWRRPPADERHADERLLALEREAQILRLELAEREKILANLETALERQHRDEDRRVNEAVQHQIEKLLSEAATPLTHLLTQAHLLEVASKPLQAKDVLAVAKRVIRVLEQGGLKLEGNVGDVMTFDPDRHEPLNADLTVGAGQAVVVRFAGVTFREKMLRRARVEPVDSQ